MGAHLRWVPRGGYPSKMGDGALDLDLFEQPDRGTLDGKGAWNGG